MGNLRELAILGVVAGGLVSIGCGDPQVSNQFRGEPLWSTQGELVLSGSSTIGLSPLRLALFFAPRLGGVAPDDLIEHAGSNTPVSLPSYFQLNVFDAPGPEHMVKAPDGHSAGFGIGRLMVYLDTNGDGRRQPIEPFVGTDIISVVAYAPAALSPGLPLPNGLPAGFSKLKLPQPCFFAPPPATTEGDCGVNLGSVCSIDTDCGSGVCHREADGPWPAGYCTIYEQSTTMCRPGRAAFLHWPFVGAMIKGVVGLYLRPCTTDAECLRPEDHDTKLYSCDPGLRGCVPSIQVPPLAIVGLGPDPLPLSPFCALEPMP